MLAISKDWVMAAWLAGAVLMAALVGHFLIFRILRQVAKRTKSVVDNSLVKHCYHPLQWVVIVFVIRLALPVALPGRDLAGVQHLLSVLFIGLVSWLLIKTIYVFEDYIASRFTTEVKDNLRARKIQTQLKVIKRIVTVVIIILALGTILMTFPKVRQLGTTILASAGIIGLVVGMAAQRTIGTFIAGLQIAITQPIRIDDVVIVENEWGRIEEITLTYVVVKIWDLRRLIVPITYFIEKPFQNWTRTTADILGTVYIYTDYTVSIDAVREQLQRVLKNSQSWDGKVCVLQVTNTTERTIELRALMSAADASAAWNLRCHVREKLVEFIRESYPEALPRMRAELHRLKE
ncbi:MAG TPA: mechanosensitive ion channel domain-containing protein [Sedimentisphaerales bacterium]|nr:mechanosensitive ion channel domain-containing protein [Sedimentisphaerales bacterium]